MPPRTPPPRPRRAAGQEALSEQRQRLLQAARRAIHRGGPQVSMEDVAAEAGITKPIIYRHFGDRRGLAIALRDNVFGAMLATPNADAGRDRTLARERIASFYPVVSDLEHLRRVIVGWATAFQMFVAMNRNLYLFLRAEGVLDGMWKTAPDAGGEDPVAVSLASSLRAIFGRQIEDGATMVWAQAVRGMVRGLVDWASQSPDHDRLQLERQFDILAGALLEGLRLFVAEETRGEKRAARGRRSPSRRAGSRR